MPDAHTPASLPRPFYSDWPPSAREAAQTLWQWHGALVRPQTIGTNGTSTSVDVFFAEEQRRAAAGEPMRMVRERVWQRAYRVCEEYDLNRAWLAEQVGAAQRLQSNVRFETNAELKAFVQSWAIPHGRLLGGLAEADNTWQVRYLDELARAFFHLGRLLTLPHDLKNGRLFLPLEDLRRNEVPLKQLRAGGVTEGVRRLLWKESIRVRDALAQGQPLLKELGLWHRMMLKRWWLGALEMLQEIERRDYDLWSRPPTLSIFRRAQVYLQTLFGRAATG
jgi:phytoene synthase